MNLLDNASGWEHSRAFKKFMCRKYLKKGFKTSKIFTSLTLLLIFFFYNTEIFYCGEIDG